MKVQRYTYGATNVAELQAQRNVAITPKEAAEAAAKPYEAISAAAQSISADFQEIQKDRLAAEAVEDNSTAELNFATAEAQRKAIDVQAEAEGWDSDRYQTAHDEITENMLKSGESISERNRPQYEDKLKSWATMSQIKTVANVNVIKFGQSVKNTNAALKIAHEGGDYALAESIIKSAMDDERYTQIEGEELLRVNDAFITTEKLMPKYEAAVKAGTADDFLLKVEEMDLTDQEQQVFSAERTRFDKLTKALTNQVRQEQGLRTANYYHYGITRSTTPDDITAFIKENNIIDQGVMSKLYGRLKTVQEAETTTRSDYYNPASITDRKAFNEWMPSDPETPEREMFESALGIAITKNIAPQWLDGYFNRGGYNTDNPQEFAQVAEDYHSYVITTDRVPVTITEETRARFEMYHDLRMANTGSAVAAGLVLSAQKALTEDAYEANLAAFDEPEYGTVENTSPQGTITTLLEEKIESDFATRMGLNLTEKGLVWDTDKVPPMPPALRREANRVARNMWAYTTNEEVAANAAFGALRASGWSATEINNGVSGPGDTTMGYQYMRNPPTKPMEVTRAELAQDIEGVEFQIPGEYKDGTALFNWRTVDASEIELGEGQIYQNEAGEQKMRWPEMINGEQLLVRVDGETKLQFFEYGEQPRVNEEDFLLIEEAHKRASEEGRRRSISIDPDLKF